MQKTSPPIDHLLSVSGLLLDDKVRNSDSELKKDNNDDPGSGRGGRNSYSDPSNNATIANSTSHRTTIIPTKAKEVTPQTLNDLIATQSLTNVTSSSAPGANSRIVFATDEWFATADNLLNDAPPTFVPDLYCTEGKVMDGWETRRKRVAGHDWAVVELGGGRRGGCGEHEIWAVELDTAHFTGNHAPRVGVEVANVLHGGGAGGGGDARDWMPGATARLAAGGGVQGTGRTPAEVQEAENACRQVGPWTTVLPPTPLRPGYEGTSVHRFVVPDDVRRRAGPATHVRINYYPDGGVARMRVWGKAAAKKEEEEDNHGRANNAAAESTILPRPVSVTSVINDVVSPTRRTSTGATNTENKGTVVLATTTTSAAAAESESKSKPKSSWVAHSAEPYPHPELSSSTQGGSGLACSNKHYGVPANLIRPTYGRDMGDGWETARHPDRPPIWAKDPVTGLLDSPLMDWAVLKLGRSAPKGVSRIVLDTKHFRGNFPESVRVEGCFCPPSLGDGDVCAATTTTTPDTSSVRPTAAAAAAAVEWFVLLPRTKMGPDAEHVFDRSDGKIRNGDRAVSHVRVTIYPDGGLSRVRIYGEEEDKNGIAAPSVVHRSHL